MSPGSDAGRSEDGRAEDVHAADTGSHPDAAHNGDAPVGAACPSSQPATGSACTDMGLACEYGSDPSYSCDAVVTCMAGAWTVSQAAPSTPCPVTNVAACPATYADVSQGATCDPQANCDYPQARCFCDVQCATLCETQVDGGPNEKTWWCDVPAPPTTCPVPRPRVGSACTAAGEMCDYGACEGNVAIECTGGVWTRTFVPCPV